MSLPRSSSRSLCGLALVVLAWLLVALNYARAADVCASTGLPSPDVQTAMISPINPATDVWIIGPNCDWTAVKAYNELIQLQRRGIERVESLPKVQVVNLERNTLSRGADLSNVSGSVFLSDFSVKLLSSVIFSSVEGGTVFISDSTLTSLSSVSFPDQLDTLNLTRTQLKSLKGVELPSTLTRLLVSTSNLKAVDLTFPPLLSLLQITSAPISEIQNVAFPDSIRRLEFAGSKIAVVKGVTWPSQLDYLGFGGNPLVEFEIRKSDVAILNLLTSFIGTISQDKCTDPTAILTEINSKNVCVISDERFESLYRSTPVSPTPSPKPKTTKKPRSSTNGSTSSTYEDEEDPQDEESSAFPSEPSSDLNESGSRTEPSTTSAAAEATAAGSNSQPLTQIPSDDSVSGSRSTNKTTIIQMKSSSSSSTPTIVFGVLSGLAAVALGAWIFRSCFLSKKRRRQDDETTNDKYGQVDTPDGLSSGLTESSSSLFQEYLANDVRNDKSMLQLRISQKAIMLSKQIARGGYGVIYRGVYQGKDVAVKQMLPGTWQNDRALASFMDEIRLCATLDHPKIVSFVGIAYSSLRDLSVVIEFMPGGDLNALLQTQQDKPHSPQDWSEPWTPSKIRSKASIGQDVAEAVAYLHCLETPILHRDLKARNVLLDLQGNAKLSDFGISRELTIDETMTSEIGTAAWIAPEVLRGARYSEKADIYSLGVLLVELDRCEHPYADEPLFQRGMERPDGNATDRMRPRTLSHATQKNTQIAVLVSTGKLRPLVSTECPDQVTSLVAQCLSFNPADRPSAEEVAKVLNGVSNN